MMKLVTSGQTYDVNYILARGEALMISLDSKEPMSTIAKDLEGAAVLRATESENPNVTHTYEGYTLIMGIQRMSGGSVRVMLNRE